MLGTRDSLKLDQREAEKKRKRDFHNHNKRQINQTDSHSKQCKSNGEEKNPDERDVVTTIRSQKERFTVRKSSIERKLVAETTGFCTAEDFAAKRKKLEKIEKKKRKQEGKKNRKAKIANIHKLSFGDDVGDFGRNHTATTGRSHRST